MPDTEAEKQAASQNCRVCKYVGTCDLYKDWIRQSELLCKMGVR